MKKLFSLLLTAAISLSALSGLTAHAEETDPFAGKSTINIVYLGGSITQGAGVSDKTKTWVSRISNYFKEKYADKTVNNYNVGIGGTGSDMGIMRLERDVLSKNPDYVFVEFAVNDIFDGEVINNYLKQQLSLCDVANTSALVLGCTHFTFYKTLIRRIMLDLTGHAIPVVDGNEGTVNHLASIVEPEFVDAKPLAERIRFFESDHEVPFAKYEHLLNRAHFENAGGY